MKQAVHYSGNKVTLSYHNTWLGAASLAGWIIEHMHIIIRVRPLMISLKTVRLLLPNCTSQVFPLTYWNWNKTGYTLYTLTLLYSFPTPVHCIQLHIHAVSYQEDDKTPFLTFTWIYLADLLKKWQKANREVHPCNSGLHAKSMLAWTKWVGLERK
jgi:hypothetical protein